MEEAANIIFEVVEISTPEEMRKVLRYLNRNGILWHGEKKIPQTTIRAYDIPTRIVVSKKSWKFGTIREAEMLSADQFLA